MAFAQAGAWLHGAFATQKHCRLTWETLCLSFGLWGLPSFFLVLNQQTLDCCIARSGQENGSLARSKCQRVCNHNLRIFVLCVPHIVWRLFGPSAFATVQRNPSTDTIHSSMLVLQRIRAFGIRGRLPNGDLPFMVDDALFPFKEASKQSSLRMVAKSFSPL